MNFKYLIVVFILSIFCLLFLIFDLSKSKRIDTSKEVLVVTKGWKEGDCNNENVTKVVNLGERATAGYSIKFIESYTVNDYFYIILREVKPKLNDGNLQVITNPCIGLKIPETKKMIEIRWE